MKILSLLSIIILFLSINLLSKDLKDVKINYPSIKDANKLLTTEDDYTNSWSSFDIDSRMQKKNSSKEELFDYIKKQTLEWTEEEKNKLNSIIKRIISIIEDNNYKLNFPDELTFIKSTCNNEGGAMGYTRANYIVLKDQLLNANEDQLSHIVLHEIFHVLSRRNQEFRKAMYAIIGFKIMESVDYPKEIKDFRISNPDATQTDSYIELTVGDKKVNAMMVMYSKRDYEGGSFFNYLNIGFLSIAGENKKSVEYSDGKPVIYEIQEISGFIEQIGRNTQYIINPEEIAAENFALAILEIPDLPSSEIINEIKVLISG